MTIGTKDVNDLGPSKFRTQADSNQEHICYYNCKERDTSFYSFLAVRKHTLTISDITFSIVKIIGKTNKNTGIYFEINNELSDFNHDNFKRTIQRISEGDTYGQQERHTTRNNWRINNNSNKPQCKYTTTRVKSITFLSNISYVGINKEDFYNENFIFDVYLLVTKNLNPFSHFHFQCIPERFYKHVCKDKSFLYLNGKNVLQPKVSEIITDFLKEKKRKLPRVEKQVITVQGYFSVRIF